MWFGDKATLDLRPGSAGELGWPNGMTRTFRVEWVEEPSTFGFTWLLYGLEDDDPRRTYVELTLEPGGPGIRLHRRRFDPARGRPHGRRLAGTWSPPPRYLLALRSALILPITGFATLAAFTRSPM